MAPSLYILHYDIYIYNYICTIINRNIEVSKSCIYIHDILLVVVIRDTLYKENV